MSVAKHLNNYGVRTKWQTHLTYLHLETLRVHINSLSDINRNSRNYLELADAILGNRRATVVTCMACIDSSGKRLGQLPKTVAI